MGVVPLPGAGAPAKTESQTQKAESDQALDTAYQALRTTDASYRSNAVRRRKPSTSNCASGYMSFRLAGSS